ncbi:Uncharacterized protein QTN25_005555 [Entamoeba marina]
MSQPPHQPPFVEIKSDVKQLDISSEFIPRYYNACMCCHGSLENPRHYCIFCIAKRVEERSRIINERKEEIKAFRERNRELQKEISTKLRTVNKKTMVIANTTQLFYNAQQNEAAITVLQVKEKDGLRLAIEKMQHIQIALHDLKNSLQTIQQLRVNYSNIETGVHRLLQLHSFLLDQIVLKKRQQIQISNELFKMKKTKNDIINPTDPIVTSYQFINYTIKSNSKMFKAPEIGKLFVTYVYMVYKHYCYILEVPCTLVLLSNGINNPLSLTRKGLLKQSQPTYSIMIPEVGINI